MTTNFVQKHSGRPRTAGLGSHASGSSGTTRAPDSSYTSPNAGPWFFPLSLPASAAVLLCLAPVGTGGVFAPQEAARLLGGYSQCTILAPRKRGSEDSETDSSPIFQTVPEQVALIQIQMGLSITDIAAVLGVTRASIHTWIRRGIVPRRRVTRRLEDLVALATEWSACGGSPQLGRVVSRSGSNPNSLLDLLSKDEWNHGQIEAMLTALRASEGRADRPLAAKSSELPSLDDADRRQLYAKLRRFR